MLFSKSTKRVEKRAGIAEGYHLETDKMEISVDTNAGGWEKFEPIAEKRYFYMLDGLGTAKMGTGGEEYELSPGSFVEVPSRKSFTMEYGQFRYVNIKGDVTAEIKQGPVHFESLNKGRLVFVLDGIGNYVSEGTPEILREKSLVEIPANTSFDIKGNIKYILVTEN